MVMNFQIMDKLRFYFLNFGVMLLLFAGCTAQTPSYTLSGTVSLDGKPIQTGTILFLPNDPAMQMRPTEFTITDGTFAVKPPFGIAAGKYKVSVVGFDDRFPDGYVLDHTFEPGNKSYTLNIEIDSKAAPKRR
jgi:hypothetical protein